MSSSHTRVIELRFYLCVNEFQKKYKIFHTLDKNMKTHQMPNDTSFSSKWLQKTDSTGKPCSIWLRQGKEKSTFMCIVCNVELSCANGGWTNVKNHAERPKHMQHLKDVMESGQLIASTTSVPSTSTSSTEK
jgi:hypothetical protein